MQIKKKMKASFTVEAALVMPLVLLSIVMLILGGFKLHDIVLGNLLANELAELYGHLPEDGDFDGISIYGNTRLEATLSGEIYSVYVERYKDGSVVRLSSDQAQREYEDAGSRPEKTMRKLTLIEEALKK